MSRRREFRLSVVFEFAGQPGHMMQSLLENLREMVPGLQVTLIGGLFKRYVPGGVRPERLANLAWVYLRVAAHLLFRRPDAVLVQSAPPGVQHWTVAWAAFRGAPVFCWLMDYHPEFEAQALERRGHLRLACLLRRVDALLMRRFAAIITLDDAMTDLVLTRTSPNHVLQHPTWATDATGGVAPVSYAPGDSDGPLLLAYSGSLGAAHDLAPLRILLETVSRRRRVSLVVVGGSNKGVSRFKELCAGLGVPLETIPRASSFGDLRAIYERLRIDAGIVLLSGDSAGLASPSKFSGYVNFGLPLVYLGPPGTNAATICSRFRGGFWLPIGAGRGDAEIVASGLLDRRQMAAAAAGARAAAEHFSKYDGKSLASALAPLLMRGPS
jgi:colanic acid biosynthesis glycosyl transferase WcaI